MKSKDNIKPASLPAEGPDEECGIESPDGYICAAYTGHTDSHSDGDGHTWPVTHAAFDLPAYAKEHLDRLDEIHKDVQGKIHDQWDWMDAAFAVEVLRTIINRYGSKCSIEIPVLPAEGPEDSVNLCARKDCRHDLRIHTWEGKPEFSACKDCECHEFLSSTLCVCTANHSEHSFSQPWPHGHCERTGCANFVPASLPAEGVAVPIQRYGEREDETTGCMNVRRKDDGQYVMYEDHLAALSKSAALRKQRDEFEQKGKDLCVALGNLGIHIHELGLRVLPGSKMGEWKYYNERAETAEAKLKETV